LLIEDTVAEEYEKIKKLHEKKVGDRIEFIFILGTAVALHEQLGFGAKLRRDFINAMAAKINEISSYLAGNKVIEGSGSERKETYDVDYNRDYLRRLADEYGVPFNEEVFNDDL
jgi:outer membrane lipoprotein-sorting protein